MKVVISDKKRLLEIKKTLEAKIKTLKYRKEKRFKEHQEAIIDAEKRVDEEKIKFNKQMNELKDKCNKILNKYYSTIWPVRIFIKDPRWTQWDFDALEFRLEKSLHSAKINLYSEQVHVPCVSNIDDEINRIMDLLLGLSLAIESQTGVELDSFDMGLINK